MKLACKKSVSFVHPPTALLLLLCATRLGQAAAPPDPPRLKRADSFLGIHFDLHAGEDCTEMGKNTTPAMVERIIDLVHPDYLQIDCKGHPGLSSYPTKVGHPAPGFVGDPLRVWRDVTARRGVALYMHYSGVWDSKAVKEHPEWAAINADGGTNNRATSFFGPYAHKLLIPQLRELAGDYGVDGAWVDGECWASVPDYGEAALKAFRDSTGIQDVPRKPSDPHWYEFLQFHRQLFRDYLNHYIAEVKQTNPEFQICSNWAFTDHMPEPVCAPVDFLSGDYSPQNSVNSARLSARFLARQGKPWDLMAWSFSTQPDRRQKTAVQLQREAAVVLALGGGFQAYYKQKRDGSIYDEQMPVMAEVAKFCRARQAVCHHAEMVPQVALLFSTAAHYRRVNGLFSRDNARISGTLQALLEGQQSVEVLAEHHLAGRLSEYPLIVVPEWEYLEPQFKSDLVAYVRSGGSLLLIGPRTAALFASELGVTLAGEPKTDGPVYLAHDGSMATMKGERQAVKLTADTVPVGRLHDTDDVASASQPAALVAKLGRGKIAATCFTFGRGYYQAPADLPRRFLNDLVRQLLPEPLVEVIGSSDIDVCVARNHGNLLVNLVNTAGPHRTQSILDSIPPVGPLTVTVRQPEKPAKVTLEPAGQPVAFEYRDGRLRLTVEQVTIHDIIVVTSNHLDGWQSFHQDGARTEDVWSVGANGVLHCKGTPLGYLYTEQKYDNFVMELDYRWPPETKPGRGGILIRVAEPHKIWPKSLEAQINSPDAGDFWGLNGYALQGPDDRFSTLEHPEFGRLRNLKKTEPAEEPAGQWNHYKIVADGTTVTLEINGRQVNRATGCETEKGHIALTAEGNPIQFRNIRVTPLAK